MSFQGHLDFSKQLPLETQVKIAEGMAQADANANEKWKHIYDAAVVAVARRMKELTSDDVLEELKTMPGAPGTHNLSAIGPAMQRAKKNDFIKPTNQTTRSKRPEKNGNLHRIWVSNYYRRDA